MSKDDFSQKIVSVAAEVFNRFGYKKTTMDEIAAELGKGKSSIYYYFKSKEEIFQSVVEKEANFLRAEVRRSFEDINDPKEQIKIYVLTRMKAYKKVINFNNAMKDDILLHLDFVKQIRSRFDLYEIELLEKILTDGVKSGEFAIEDPNMASIGIATALKGLEVPILESTKDEDIELRLDNLLNILFNGIIKR